MGESFFLYEKLIYDMCMEVREPLGAQKKIREEKIPLIYNFIPSIKRNEKRHDEDV